ncbi:STM3941 family protein [Actinoplanes sp. NPDC049802]|uniref:STM3941 family protein n=1 Tax=Actinoplanes sp. NPDC049802 TaxID=3154742 RepID=UPI0033C8FED2
MVVHRSVPKSLGLLLGAVALICASGFVVVDALPGLPAVGSLLQLGIGLLGMLFFGIGLVKVGRQLLQRGPVVEIGPDGVRDVRLSNQLIPWTVVRRVREVKVQRQRFVVLDVDEAFEREFLTGGTAMLHRINQSAGFSGVHLSATGLRCNADELYAAVLRYWN